MAHAAAVARPGVPRPDPIPRNPWRGLVSPYLWLAVTHLLLDVVVATVGFVVVVVTLSTSFGLLFVALAGVLTWIVGAYVVRALGAFERGRSRLLLGLDVPDPGWPRRSGSLPRYVWSLLSSGVIWRQTAYFLVLFPWSLLAAPLVIGKLAVALALATMPLYYAALPSGSADLVVGKVDSLPEALLMSAVGVGLLHLLPLVVSALRSVDAALCRGLLGAYGTTEIAERVDELAETRRRSMDAAEAERRRIERDLHDGAQQRLVALAMTLGRARSRLGDVDDDTRQLVDEAHAEAKRAIVELRDLTRGLHPPVLTDRGLDAALSALAARSPVPVEVEVDVDVRPSATIESMAYFVVAEALTNVAKHSGARTASVVVRNAGPLLRVVVRDDGMGGADPRGGSGISGIADRISGVDGRLRLESPLGGPTVLTVDLPCVS